MRASGNHRSTPSAGTIAIAVLVWTALVAASLLAELCGGLSRRVAAAGGILDSDVPRPAPRVLALPLTWSHTSMWLIGLLGVAVATRLIRTRFRERLRVEDALRLDEARLQALLSLHQQSGAPVDELSQFALDESVRLTESQMGYLAFLDEDERTVTMQAWFGDAMPGCIPSDGPQTDPLAWSEPWSEVYRQRQSLTINDLNNLHCWDGRPAETGIAVRRHMHVPVFDGRRIVILAGVGNKPTDYDEADERQVALIMSELWRIVQRKQDADEIRRLNDSLERRVQERTARWEAANQELEGFSYSVSHDLRAPLRAILGFSNMLSEKSGQNLDEQGRHCVAVICSEAERMGRLIEAILDFSRASKSELQPLTIDMTELVREVYGRLIAPLADRSVDFRLQPLAAATADPTLMRQVWTNLLDNALKYSRTRDETRIEIGSETREGESVYFIRDNGVGFDPKYAGKLFQVFQRLHRPEEFEGTGIGLAIVKRIVHRHNGRIWAESSPEQGAAFFFTLSADSPQAP
jgi:signal transduction histidine kinase